MVYRNTPYDPTYYSNIPANYRYAWAKRTNRALTLTDEEIFLIWRNSYIDAPDSNAHDELVAELMGEALDEKENS